MYKTSKITSLVLALVLALTTAPLFAADKPEVVNINEASASQLAQLPRVGPALAGRILEFREENGKFEAAEDLMLVRGIGEKTFQLMEPYVTVEGKTTLTQKVRSSQAQTSKTQERQGSNDVGL